MNVESAFARHLRDRLGASSDPPPELLGRLDHTAAYAAVVAPPEADGIAAALELCAAEQWPVRAAGGCTWLEPDDNARAAARPPDALGTDRSRDRPPVVISTARLSMIVEHEPADLVIGVGAGVPLAALSEHLARHGQWLPLDPPAAPAATIGAVAALGSAGPLRAGHGTPRDMVLGVRIATGDGRLLHFGGRVVKNVAGYDGVRLVVGSRGSLGIVTELFVRVRGAPRADRTLAISCGAGPDGRQRGADLALRIRDRTTCDALELLAPRVTRGLSRSVDASGWAVVVRVLGGEAAVADAAGRVESIARSAGAEAVPASAAVWASLAALEAEAGSVIRMFGRPTTIAEALAAAVQFDIDNEWSDNELHSWFCAAHATAGVIRLWLPTSARAGSPGQDPDAGGWTAFTPVRSLDVSGDWTARYDHSAREPARPWTPRPAGVQELTGRIRAIFDPAGILTAGDGP